MLGAAMTRPAAPTARTKVATSAVPLALSLSFALLEIEAD
jgi:hypothetical protein